MLSAELLAAAGRGQLGHNLLECTAGRVRIGTTVCGRDACAVIVICPLTSSKSPVIGIVMSDRDVNTLQAGCCGRAIRSKRAFHCNFCHCDLCMPVKYMPYQLFH